MKMMDGEGVISLELLSIIENTNDFAFVKNRDFVYIASSKSYALDCVRCDSVEDVIGKTDFELFDDRSIAEGYRKDDEALFASGKPMIEFQEEFPDEHGSKRTCLVTKYLLHDKDGNPVAIFGQYHDIGKATEKERRRWKIDNHVIDAFGRPYFAANYADLVTHEFVPIRNIDYSSKMLEGCKTIEQAFDSFINTLVKSEYQDKMREFCNTETLVSRLKDKTHIDCGYLSKVAMGWCQASFFPTEWDERGNATHALFAVSTIDKGLANSLDEGISSKKRLDALFDVVPSGIVVYEWDGKNLRFVTTNGHYREWFGYRDLKEGDAPEYQPIHPDDLPGYKKAINRALTETNQLEYAFRIWNKAEERYKWLQVNAVAKPQGNGKSMVYAIFTDVTIRFESVRAYRSRLRDLESSNEDALCMCDVNITRNQFANVRAEGIIKRCAEAASTLDEFVLKSSEAVLDSEEQMKYRELFSCEGILKRFEQGETQIRFEHLYRVPEMGTMIVATIIDLINEPETGDVVGVAYAKDLSEATMSKVLLQNALMKDCPMAALVYADTGEYYFYEADQGGFCVHKSDFWSTMSTRLRGSADADSLDAALDNLRVEKVIGYLENHSEYSYAFYGFYGGRRCRFEATFRYASVKQRLMVATLRNITDLQLSRKYKHDSEHDALTGLYNRATVFERSRELLDEHPDERFVMLHIDIRRFHLYNTFFGEDAGDELLCRIADALRVMADEYDYLAFGRVSGDVFCVFFPIDRGLFENHVLRCFADLGAFSPDFPLEPAVGAYLVVDPSMSIESMFARATIAAKSGNINMYGLISCYDDAMDQSLKDTQQITSEMTTALDGGQFEVYLQPKFSLVSGEMTGSEALVRWKHPDRGMISPGKFIPTFEKNGFIAKLDRYMWEHVCQVLCKWRDDGTKMLPISVNISRVSMYSHATVPYLKSLIERYGLDPKYLELELTESAYIDDPEDLKRMLRELQEFGFKILMDDFGSGYSSLNTLRDLPVNVLKLDMKFLPASSNDTRGNAVLSSVVGMSKMLDLPIVAEGVETREQADYLRGIGCDFVQGYLYAKPMPVSEYEAMI